MIANPDSSAAQTKLAGAIAKLQSDNASGQLIAAEAASANTAFGADLNALAEAMRGNSQVLTDAGTAAADSARLPVAMTTDVQSLNVTDATTVTDFAG